MIEDKNVKKCRKKCKERKISRWSKKGGDRKGTY